MNPANSSLVSDTELEKCLSHNTNWFEKLEKARDDLIVYRKRCYYVDVMNSEGKVGKAKAKFNETRNIVDYDIKEMPNLDFLMDRISEFLHFFGKHFTQMCTHGYSGVS